VVESVSAALRARYVGWMVAPPALGFAEAQRSGLVGEKDFDADRGNQPRQIMSDDKDGRSCDAGVGNLLARILFRSQGRLCWVQTPNHILHVFIISEQYLGMMQD
jgi:hypothetical protein